MKDDNGLRRLLAYDELLREGDAGMILVDRHEA
jgi:hypothetical protein